jgi:hypothetical protein
VESPAIGAQALTLPPYFVLGHRADGRPIYPIAGGSGEDDDSTDVDVDDDTEDTDVDEPADDDKQEPEERPKPAPPKASSSSELEKLKAEHARTQAALKKANEEAKRNRLALKEHETRARANEDGQEKALREAAEAAEKKWAPRIINSAARAALAEAGVAGSPDRLLKLLDPDALSVDDEGDVIGLDTEIDRLKADYPEFFTKPEQPRPKVRPTGAPRPAAPAVPKNSWDKHAARILGR